MKSRFKLTNLAAEDLKGIAEYTLRKWGRKQSFDYKDDLKKVFAVIAANPLIGKGSSSIELGMRKFVHQAHTIFYRVTQEGILIVRILDQRMNQHQHIHFNKD